jgi:hypothetical protein
MKAVAIAAAGAALISVSAAGHAEHLRLHNAKHVARDGWENWDTSSSSTTTKPVKATTSSSVTWNDWTSTTMSTTKPVKATTTSSCVYSYTTTTTGPWGKPTVSTVTGTGYGAECTEWNDWASTSTTTKPVVASTTSSCVYEYTTTVTGKWGKPSVSTVMATGYGAECTEWNDCMSRTTFS